MNKNIKKILVWRTGYLGDTLCAIPVLNALKNKFKFSNLYYLTNKPNNSLTSPSTSFAAS